MKLRAESGAESEADKETLMLDLPGVTEASSEDENELATGSTFSPASKLGSEEGGSGGGAGGGVQTMLGQALVKHEGMPEKPNYGGVTRT